MLIATSRSNIKIYTDSIAAIANIHGNMQYTTIRKKIKKKNYNLIINIKDIIRVKKIDLELVKLKEHSNNKWNNYRQGLSRNAKWPRHR